MRVSIIKDDGTVVKDGVAYTGLDLSVLPSEFHALQWYDTKGDVESKDADGNPVNTAITDFSSYQWCVDAWQAAYDAEQAAIAAAEAAAAAAAAEAAEAAEAEAEAPAP
jgi:hypothetical protein